MVSVRETYTAEPRVPLPHRIRHAAKHCLFPVVRKILVMAAVLALQGIILLGKVGGWGLRKVMVAPHDLYLRRIGRIADYGRDRTEEYLLLFLVVLPMTVLYLCTVAAAFGSCGVFVATGWAAKRALAAWECRGDQRQVYVREARLRV